MVEHVDVDEQGPVELCSAGEGDMKRGQRHRRELLARRHHELREQLPAEDDEPATVALHVGCLVTPRPEALELESRKHPAMLTRCREAADNLRAAIGSATCPGHPRRAR